MTKITKPNHVDVADHYYKDAVDFLNRFILCWNDERYDFQAVKSKRFKEFIDLRMALECALKSICSYKIHHAINGKELVDRMRRYSHYIERSASDISHLLGEDMSRWLNEIANLCDTTLPVDIRYRFDAFDFRRNDEEIYYKTIGDDRWLITLYERTEELTKYIGSEISKESRIISGAELRDLVIAEITAYSPYRSKSGKRSKSDM